MRSFLPTCSVLLASAFPLFAQGPLTPPGPPAPTMKTLDQVEARIPIDAAHTPGDAESLFRINAPGSYYLTGNITGQSGKSGIFVAADNVTIDLNGYTMSGVPGSFRGINGVPESTARPAANVTVRNGTVTGWPGSGVFLDDRARLERLVVSDNAGGGIRGSGSSLAVDCQVSRNGGSGIELGANSIIRGCSANNNLTSGLSVSTGSTIGQSVANSNTQEGARIGTGSTIEGCSASNNRIGIFGEDRSTVLDCTVADNQGRGIDLGRTSNVQRCNASGNDGSAGILVGVRSQVLDCIADDNGPATGPASGIEGGERTIVKRCTATNNRLNGIAVAGESVLIENRASNNGAGGGSPGAGIRTTGSGSRIESNHTRDNTGSGVVASAGDFVVRNTAGNNNPGPNFSILPAPGVNFGPVQAANANPASPQANHEF